MARRTVPKLMIAAQVFFLLTLFGCASMPADWTREDTVRQVLVTGLHLADWSQTRYIARHPEEHIELNPLMSRHPSTQQVDLHFAAGLLLQTGIAIALPHRYRVWWQNAGIVCGAITVGHNNALGIRMRF